VQPQAVILSGGKVMKRAKKTDLIISCLSFFLLIVILTRNSAAQTTAFTYQGKLTDAGNPANGSYDMQFKLFDAVSGGAQQGSTITNPTVQVSAGTFTVTLDFGTNVFTGAARYLEISVRPAGSPNPYTVLAPLQQITSSPYAIQTINAQQLAGLPASRYVASDINGNVGIGTPAPVGKLDIVGNVTTNFGQTNIYAANGGQASLGFFNDNGASGWIIGRDVGGFGTNNFFIYDRANSTNRLLIDTNGHVGIGTDTAQAKLTVQNANGGRILIGDASCGNGFGAIGFAPTLAGCASYALLGNAANTFLGRPAGGALYFREANSDQMIITTGGNVGIGTITPQSKLTVQTSSNSYGLTHTDGTITVASALVSAGTIFDGGWLGTRSNHSLHFFINDGFPSMTIATNGSVGVGTSVPTAKLHVNGSSLNGVYASSNFQAFWGESFGDNKAAMQASSSGNGGFGVYAVATGDGNTVGVWGESTSSVGKGVFGKSPNHGVWGKTTGSGRGVWGDNNGSDSVGYAGYFFGRVKVTGLLEKGAGAFKIDHPLDPEHKYLLHSFVESPDMMNIYNGNVTTDDEGNATVTMPDWFEALNQDFRYQLTVIGQFAQAIIASKLRQNRFTIKTDRPHVEVSWQVTGIRHDAYARANRIQVEQEKPKDEAGTYLHPQAFGQPEEKGVEWAQQPEHQLKEPREPAQQKPPQQQQ
jgi:hypothetical protein